MKKIILAVAAVAVIGMVAAPAMAATQWNFGASLRYLTFWDQVNFGKTKRTDIQGGGASVKNDHLLDWGTAGNSRIKMFMKSDSLEGFIEMGWDFDGNKVTAREYWGKYKFNDMAYIQIGQSHQLFNTPGFSNQVWGGNDIGMHGIGVSFNPPTPKIILGYGGFSFAMAQPFSGNLTGDTGKLAGYGAVADIDTYLPQLQASYQYRADTWRVKLSGAYQHTKLNKIQDSTTFAKIANSKNINSWLVALDGNINFGPLYLAGTASVGQNWADAQWNSDRGGLRNSLAKSKPMTSFGVTVDGNKLKNTTSVMGALIAGYRLTEALRFEAGVGYRYDDNNAWDKNSSMLNAYIQAAYTVAPGFTITPEIGYIDMFKTVSTTNAVDAGYMWYAGAKWQMDF